MRADRPTPPRAVPTRRLIPGAFLLLACAAAQADLTLPRKPDSRPATVATVATGATAAAGDPAQSLRDLHGALIVSSSYRYYASILYGTQSGALQSALSACKEDEPNATCAVYASFKNQCVAVAANGAQHFVAIGKEDWDPRQTRDFSLRLCREKTGSVCRLVISACSTQAQKAEDQSAWAGPAGPLPAGSPGYHAARLAQ